MFNMFRTSTNNRSQPVVENNQPKNNNNGSKVNVPQNNNNNNGNKVNVPQNNNNNNGSKVNVPQNKNNNGNKVNVPQNKNNNGNKDNVPQNKNNNGNKVNVPKNNNNGNKVNVPQNKNNNNGSEVNVPKNNNQQPKNNQVSNVNTNFPSFKPSLNKTKLSNAMGRTDTQVKAKPFMRNVVSNQLINVKDMKTINGNKIYYKSDENGVRPILMFIKASTDSLNKSNLRILANVLSDKMPNTSQEQPVSNKKFTYIFTESGPFGSGYYHTAYFTMENNTPKIVNNPLFANEGGSSLKELTIDELIQQMRLRNNNAMFDDYTLASKTNRARNLTKLVNRLEKKNKRN